ncbi:hypothetical protein VY88_33235 [Azospirillum thiophilum]|uniref:DUF559 domain-containing protein n=1 Tax=Azospirillum thiophilum TaxID=528244 RepID=A0AAC8W686_9PROT|nr:hypothetical protein [Azospirillum thiophilum]ALG75749.1 hypothetical protein AL072_32985 [Azospirillum thiophilum]KJR61198.1 hypothetical protein VY88_33235 [Azospirillum thiophilum]
MDIAASGPLLSRYEIDQVKPPESPIEAKMLDLLMGGLNLGYKATFAAADTWQDAVAMLRAEPETFSRNRICVFPQVGVDRYRADMLVAFANQLIDRIDAWDGFDLMFIECDGEEFHGEDSGRLRADRDRERAIKAATGLDVLRFSGAEISFYADQVGEVISTYLESYAVARRFARLRLEHAMKVHDYARSETQDMVPETPTAILRARVAARDLAGMPWARREYQTQLGQQNLALMRRAAEAMRAWAEEATLDCPACPR